MSDDRNRSRHRYKDDEDDDSDDTTHWVWTRFRTGSYRGYWDDGRPRPRVLPRAPTPPIPPGADSPPPSPSRKQKALGPVDEFLDRLNVLGKDELLDQGFRALDDLPRKYHYVQGYISRYLRQSPAIESWNTSQRSRVLVIDGNEPGELRQRLALASRFAARKIEETEQQRSAVVLYWFCGGYPAKNRGSTLARYFIGKMLTDPLSVCDRTNFGIPREYGPNTLNLDFLRDCLRDCIEVQRRETPVVCVIDCVDKYAGNDGLFGEDMPQILGMLLGQVAMVGQAYPFKFMLTAMQFFSLDVETPNPGVFERVMLAEDRKQRCWDDAEEKMRVMVGERNRNDQRQRVHEREVGRQEWSSRHDWRGRSDLTQRDNARDGYSQREEGTRRERRGQPDKTEQRQSGGWRERHSRRDR